MTPSEAAQPFIVLLVIACATSLWAGYEVKLDPRGGFKARPLR